MTGIFFHMCPEHNCEMGHLFVLDYTLTINEELKLFILSNNHNLGYLGSLI